MQGNKFEKEVKKKMEELNFSPSVPVWEHIEQQIRKKRDRRRILLWLPFLFLFLGGGIWLTIKDYKGAASLVTTTAAKDNAREREEGNIVSERPIEIPKKSQEPINEKQAGQFNMVDQRGEDITAEKKFRSFTKAIKSGANKKNNNIGERNFEKDILTEKENSITKEGKQEKIKQPAEVSENKTGVPNATTQSDTLQSVITQNKEEDSTENSDKKIEQQKPALKKGKWTVGIVAYAGVSGVGKSIAPWRGGAQSANGPLNAGNFASSYPKNGLAFSAGLRVQRKLSERLSVETGINFSSYSTRLSVGELRFQDTIVVSATGTVKSVERFYTNSNNNPGGANNSRDFHNKYHFISVPLSLNWKMSQKIPLYFNGGFSINQLVYSNALLYDAWGNLYYKDKNAFSKTQLFMQADISYSLSQKSRGTFLLGPQVQLGLSRLEKLSRDKHLFSMGIKMQYLFNRN